MTNDEFRELYSMLNDRHKHVAGDHVGLKSLHAGGIITFSRHVRSQLEKFETEVARRAKAEAENARNTEGCVRNDFGADAYDKLLPEYTHGLNFGDTIK